MLRLKKGNNMESVDLIASGYEWVCPHCDKLNREIEITQTVTCRVSWADVEDEDEIVVTGMQPCGREFEISSVQDAYK